MIDRSEAEEHLRVIRSLMEKATIYRAISAEAAAVGGVLALAASFAFGNWVRASGVGSSNFPAIIARNFFLLWLGVLAVAAVANIWFLWRGARERGEEFVSPGMRLAIRALLPSYAVAGFFTVLIYGSEMPALVVPVWIICHGLALLSTTCFAPRSLAWLGVGFLIVGMVSFYSVGTTAFHPIAGAGGVAAAEIFAARNWRGLLLGQQWMALSFGLLHLIYAVCTWPRRAR